MTWILRLFSLLLGYAFGNCSGDTLVKALGQDKRLAPVIDVLKCVICLLFIRWATTLTLDNNGVMIAAIGLVLGHLYPYWTQQRADNAMLVIATSWVMINFTWGISALLIGAFVIFVTHIIPLGAMVVPIFGFVATLFMAGWEQRFYALILLIFAIIGYREDFKKILAGKYPKTDFRTLWKK